jgi:hypothetical protein
VSETSDLDAFARLLMKLVRDRAISECDRLAEGAHRGLPGDPWLPLASDPRARQRLGGVIPEVVDLTLFYLLDAIDGGDLPLGWRTPDGSWLALRELGMREMGGWLMGGEGGWRDRFSSQRYFDETAGLRLARRRGLRGLAPEPSPGQPARAALLGRLIAEASRWSSRHRVGSPLPSLVGDSPGRRAQAAAHESCAST